MNAHVYTHIYATHILTTFYVPGISSVHFSKEGLRDYRFWSLDLNLRPTIYYSVYKHVWHMLAAHQILCWMLMRQE